MDKPACWAIIGRGLRFTQAAKAGHGAGVGAEAQDAVAGAQALLEQRVVEIDDMGEAAAAAAAEARQAGHVAAAVPDFIFSVQPPPFVTFGTTGLSCPYPPAKPDKSPRIIATGPFWILAAFCGEVPRDINKFYYFKPEQNHLVVISQFHYGSDGQIAACGEIVPDRGDDLPRLFLGDLHETVGLLCDDDDRSYLVAQLKITTGTDSLPNALLVCYRSVLGAWSRNLFLLDVPLPLEVRGAHNRSWLPHGTLALDSTILWFDLSWGLLSLDFSINLRRSDFRLVFSSLPAGRDLGGDNSDYIYRRRCITVSEKLVRFVEIIVPNKTVAMWCRRRQVGANGWEWAPNYQVSFQEIWNDDSYVVTGLPRRTPMLACVSPVDANIVYFTLEKCLFGVNVPERRVMHSQPIGREMQLPDTRRFVTWILPKRGAPFTGYVSPDQPGDDFPDDPDDAPQDPKGKSKGKSKLTDDRRKSSLASNRPSKSPRIK